jgi:hypothetical protein
MALARFEISDRTSPSKSDTPIAGPAHGPRAG